MLKLPPITIAFAMLPLLTACGQHVRSADPICPEPIVLSKAFTDPIPLPSWFAVPPSRMPSSSTPRPAPPKCVKRP